MKAAGFSTNLLATAAILAAAAACGGDDDGGGGPIDAAAFIDSGPLPDARSGSNFWLVSCGPEPEYDAGPDSADAGPDAGAPDAGDGDAGPQPPPGFDDPCCNPDGVCPSGLECIADVNRENGTCRPVCIGDDNLQCPFGGVCAQFGGQNICIPASGDGDDCDPELCEAGFICVGTDSENATCRKRCTGPDDCGEGYECEVVSSGSMACL